MPRIAFARLQQESNALSPVTTTREDFERSHYIQGAELLERCQKNAHEVDGFLKHAELSGFVQGVQAQAEAYELVPLFSLWAITGGPLARDAWEYHTDQLIERLQDVAKDGLDGFFLAIHGALCVRGIEDPEGRLMERLREVLGPDMPIAISMDLHAHLTPRKVDTNSLLFAYRTNPHRDHRRVGRRAAEVLCRVIRQEVQPTIAWRTLPLVLGGGHTIDFLAPMRAIFRWMNRAERNPKVLYVNLFMVHLWLDADEMGWATHIITDDDPELAERLAEELADLCWEVRHQQPPEFPSAAEAVAQAKKARLQRKLGTVCMSDGSDMVGAGGTGENTALLREFKDSAPELRLLLPLRDAPAVRELHPKKPGDPVDMLVGGHLDPERNTPVQITGTIRSIHPDGPYGRIVVVDDGNFSIVLTEGAPLVMQPKFYRDLGLSPWEADVVVVKSLFPFRVYFALQNRKTIYAKTNGITDFDAGLNALASTTPVWPRDDVREWRSTDRRRRGLDT